MKIKEVYIAIIISILTYLTFFYPLLNSGNFFATSDAEIYYYPAREYFYNTIIEEGRFPFWTEKQFSGFAIFADLETAYLNIPNIISILLFGPALSYKILHFLQYFIGSMALYYFLKKRGINVLSFAVANTAYFFSSFFINRQIHFGIVMAMYIFPLLLLLFDLYLEKRQLRYILFAALAFCLGVFYWGHLQATLIAFIGFFLYIAVGSFKRLSLKNYIFYNIALGFLIVLFSLPQLYPTYTLATRSIRSEGVNLYQGSFTPNMILLTAYPSVFTESVDTSTELFEARHLRYDYSFVETYSMYFGITVLILAMLGLLLSKDDRIKIYAVVLLFVFFIMGFLEYLPRATVLEEIPLLPLFRYWGRTAVLGSFGIAILAAKGAQIFRERNVKITRTSLLLLAAVIGYWAVFLTIRSNKFLSQQIQERYINNLPNEKNFEIWLGLLTVTAGLVIVAVLISLFLHRIGDKYKLWIVLQIAFLVLVVFDLRYFQDYILKYRIQEILPIKKAEVPDSFEKKRIIFFSRHMRGMENLYYDNWSPFGYAQLADSNYVDVFKTLAATERDPWRVRRSGRVLFEDQEIYDSFQQFGIYAIIYLDKTYYLKGEEFLDILENDIRGEYLVKEEGNIVFVLNEPQTGTISTYIKNYPGWTLKIDGNPAGFTSSDEDMFLKFDLEAEDQTIELKYIPSDFYQALAGSAILGGVAALSVKNRKTGKLIDKLVNK
jgi:hypothetical protein